MTGEEEEQIREKSDRKENCRAEQQEKQKQEKKEIRQQEKQQEEKKEIRQWGKQQEEQQERKAKQEPRREFVHLRLTPHGIDVSNQIFVDFML